MEDDGVDHHEITFPIKSNPFYFPDRDYDCLFIKKMSIYKRIVRKIKKLSPREKPE